MSNDQTNLEYAVSICFWRAFYEHPQRKTDPALVLEAAREEACKAIPPGVHGSFDDQELTWTQESE